MPDGGGERKNTGKLRYGLEPTIARIHSIRNLEHGAKKYSDFNWARGMSWRQTIECAERHLMKIKAGVDIDPEDGEPHAAKVISNMQFMLEFLYTYPKGDDRRHHWLDLPKVVLDIDEVLADWVGAWIERGHIKSRPRNWSFSYETRNLLAAVKKNRAFWLGIKPLVSAQRLKFEPVGYVTARVCSADLTSEWLEMHGFPTRPVINVGPGGDKVEAVKSLGADVYVDDNFDTFVAMNKAGIPTFLFDRTHNKKYDVGAKRIKDLNVLVQRPT